MGKKKLKAMKSLQELNMKIFINDRHQNTHFHYPTNGIQTRKFTLISFVPKSLYLQFLRIANVYFLFSAIISSIGEVSSIGPATSIFPLAFVLVTSMFREGYEDWVKTLTCSLV